MTEEIIRYKADWFQPENPDQKIAGTLEIDSKSNITLHLENTFFPGTIHTSKEISLIHGITFDGQIISLIDCILISFSSGASKTITSYLATSCLIGSQTYSSDLKFNKAFIKTDFLTSFINYRTFDVKSSNPGTEHSINTLAPYQKEINVTSNLKAIFRCYNNHNFSKDLVEIRSKSNIIIESQEDITIASFTNHFIHILKLFSILSVRSLTVKGVLFFTNIGRYDENLFITAKHKSLSKNVIYDRGFVLKLEEINLEFDLLILKWIEEKEKINAVATLLIDSFNDSNSLLESKFLSLCQFLEVFHKRFRHNEINADKAQKSKEAIDDSRGSNKEWLSGVLDNIKYPSFRERIAELLEEGSTNELFKAKISGITEIENKIVRSRHYYTHYNKDHYEKCLKGFELLETMKALRILSTYLILRQMNLSVEILNKYMSGRKYIFD